MSDLVLAVDNVSKKFCKNLKRSMVYASQDIFKSSLGFRQDNLDLRKGEFWALDKVNFSLERGDTLGLMGGNGSGKTTLLRLIAGLFPPSSGTIRINGRVASLIAVGAGFHPHMTGRENIFLNGAILGMSKQHVQEKFDWIVDFAEIESFLDAPVATYSSGMRVRLGFAIATSIEPDLLLLDEILAVGDVSFRMKCYKRISEIKKKSAIVFVSHSLEQLYRICDKGILLSHGKQVDFGEIASVAYQYDSLSNVAISDTYKNFNEKLFGNFAVKLEKESISYRENIVFNIDLDALLELNSLVCRVVVYNKHEEIVGEFNSTFQDQYLDLKLGRNQKRLVFEDILLAPGNYSINFVINGEFHIEEVCRSYKEMNFEVKGDFFGHSAYQIKGKFNNN